MGRALPAIRKKEDTQTMKKQAIPCALLALALAGSMALAGCGGQTAPAESTAETAAAETTGQMFSVTLDPNGGAFADGSTEPRTIQVAEGTAVAFRDYPLTREGDTHIGWYLPDGAPWPGARKVTGDLDLVAKWTATVEEVVYPLVLTNAVGDAVPMQCDNNVYQFTVVSTIYGGYAQRSGTYTLYGDELQAAIDADDGSTGRVLVRAASNYVDATGTLYAELYNDGTYDLYYDYTNGGERTKYCMETGSWTLEGYTAPITPDAVPEDGSSRHTGWDESLLGAEASTAETAESDGGEAEQAEFVTIPGETIFEVPAENSDTMSLRFCANGVAAIYMSTYETDVDAGYLWSYDKENGLTVHYHGGEENAVTLDGDTAALADNFGNTYSFAVSDLAAAIPQRELLFTAESTNSDTMKAEFYADGGFAILFDMTAYGAAGQFSTVAQGQWGPDDAGAVQLALNGAQLELTQAADGWTFATDGNTYAIPSADYDTLAG